MADWLPLFMFIGLFGLIGLGQPVAFSLTVVAVVAGLFTFGDSIFNQLYGQLLKVSSDFLLASIPLFVLMGAFLERSGIALRLFEAMQMWLGRFSGGLALATIVMCAIFAAATGVVGAVEIVVGMMAIPAMKRHSFDNALIAGTICAGGSLGTTIPPSITVVVYASIAQLSIGDLFSSIMLPGLLMVAGFLGYIILHCKIWPHHGPRVTGAGSQVPLARKLRITLTALVPAVALIMAVLGSLLMGIASPTEAAAVGAFGAIALTAAYGQLTATVIRDALVTTINVTAMIMFIVVGGTMFTGIFAAAGGGSGLADWVSHLALSPGALIAICLVIVFAAGFVLDWISIVLIFVPIFLPLLNAADVDPIWFATMFLIVIQTSYLSPPMAPSIFYLKAVAPADMTYMQMYRGVVPFIGVQLLVLAAVATVPALATWMPGVLMGGFGN